MELEEVKESIKSMVDTINDEDMLLFVQAYIVALKKKVENVAQ